MLNNNSDIDNNGFIDGNLKSAFERWKSENGDFIDFFHQIVISAGNILNDDYSLNQLGGIEEYYRAGALRKLINKTLESDKRKLSADQRDRLKKLSEIIKPMPIGAKLDIF